MSDIDCRKALVKLSPPSVDDDNSAAVDLLNYELCISEKRDGKYKPVYSGTANEITLKDLKPAVEYHLR